MDNRCPNVIIQERVTDLNNPPEAYILQSSVNPVGFPTGLGGNGCFVIQHNGIGDTMFRAQLAFGFGSDKLAIRRKFNSSTWLIHEKNFIVLISMKSKRL